MAEVTILEGVLLEEYERAVRTVEALAEAMRELPRGYLRERERNGRTYYYLQRREGNRVVSEYVPRERVNEVRAQVERRHELAAGLKVQERSRRQIEKALGRRFIDEHTAR